MRGQASGWGSGRLGHSRGWLVASRDIGRRSETHGRQVQPDTSAPETVSPSTSPARQVP